MYKSIFLIFFIVLGAIPGTLFAQERIQRFDGDMTLNADASVDVVETIIYDFGEVQKHGIYRTIPVKYKTDAGNTRSIHLMDIAVTDEHGTPYTFTTSRSGDDMEVRIGDADRVVHGAHTYVIAYTVEGALNFFDTHDELYWNVTGDAWNVPIATAHGVVHVPMVTSTADITATCFAGTFGTTQTCDNMKTNGNTIAFSAATLGAHDGLTIVVGVPKGIIAVPSIWQKMWQIVRDNGILVLPLVVAGFMFRRWWRNGRDPKGRGTIVPQWEIPDDLSPAEVGTIIDERAQAKDISSLFIDLAVRGHLKIVHTEKKGIFGKADYTLVKQKEWGDEVRPFEKTFLEALFTNRDRVDVSTLKNTFYKDFAKIITQTYAATETAGYFVKNPQKVRTKYLFIGGGIFFGSIWLGSFLAAFLGGFVIVAGVVSGLIVIAFSFFMPKRTPKGARVREQILGLKRYLETAEKRRLDFHNAPQKKPETFEKYLPYAMVLGVESAWAEQFTEIYNNQQPSWYEGSSPANALALTHAASSFSSVATAAAVSKPSSASSGGSGFSGGGSGGGMGGGGGGSW